jgi:hypothetical protein
LKLAARRLGLRCTAIHPHPLGSDPMPDNARMVKICDLWERISARGTRYFSGYAGPVQYLLFDAGERPHPTRPDEMVHVWRMMVQESDPDRRPALREQRETVDA